MASATSAVRLGASDYLTKPFDDPSVVTAAVDQAMQKYRQRTSRHHHLQQLESRLESLAELIDRLPQGVIVVRQDSQVVLCNRSAREVLDQRDGLWQDDGGRLVSARADQTRLLRSMIQRASHLQQDNPSGGALTIQRADNSAPLSLMVTPMLIRLNNVDPGQEPNEQLASVFVNSLEHSDEATEAWLVKLYGLTPTEARLSAIMMRGRSLEQSAEEMEVSRHTIRTHLRHIFQKTETSRQGELISLLLNGPALLGPAGND